jgi:hypothetical protein
VVHLHLHIIRIEGALGWVVSGLGGWIWDDWSVIGASAGIPNHHMTLFEVLHECMEVVQLKSTTRVITALESSESRSR